MRFGSTGNDFAAHFTAAIRKVESGPSSVLTRWPPSPAARPSRQGFQFQPSWPGPLQTPALRLGSWLAQALTGPITRKPCLAISEVAPLWATVRLSMVDSTEPVSGTNTGARSLTPPFAPSGG